MEHNCHKKVGLKQLFLEVYKHIERNNFFSPSSRGKVDKSQTQQGEKVTKIYTLNTPNLFKFFYRSYNVGFIIFITKENVIV